MAYRWLGVLLLSAACTVGCGNEGTGGPRSDGGVGGDGGTSGASGAGGAGGAGGGAGGGGTGGGVPACTTSPLCGRCPSQQLCDVDDDCEVGHLCVESGCSTDGGAPVKQCKLAPAGACATNEDCPPERECTAVPGEGKLCVKTTPGCNTSFDCVLGFSCEGGICVDRRVPCFLDDDCPKSHFCEGFDTTQFCRRAYVSCEAEFDCAGIAPRCEDVDGDGTKECASVLNPNAPSPQACLNTMCSDPTPVCELGNAGFTACGQYGPCAVGADCVDGFECLGLWPDGRSECVPTGGSCSQISDCPVQQVCAAPRTGGPPSCQRGVSSL